MFLGFGPFVQAVQCFTEVVERFGFDGAVVNCAGEFESGASVSFSFFSVADYEVKVGEIVEQSRLLEEVFGFSVQCLCLLVADESGGAISE